MSPPVLSGDPEGQGDQGGNHTSLVIHTELHHNTATTLLQ